MSRVSAIYHIVINTKNRCMTISETSKKELYRYIYGIIQSRKAKLLRINGIANHLHILIDLPPTMALSDMVREIKRASSIWLKQCGLFPTFDNWGKEYFAATVASKDVNAVIEYIKGQEAHHLRRPFEDEFKALVTDSGLDWGEYLLS